MCSRYAGDALATTLLTTKEAAALLRVHPKQIYRLLKQGLPAVRVGDEWRFERESLLSWTRKSARAAGRDESAVARNLTEEAPPFIAPLLAANGDVAVDILLRMQPAAAPPVGFVLSDHAGAHRLLHEERVLLAGAHEDVGLDQPNGDKKALLHIATREIGLAGRKRPPRSLGALVGKRLAIRPRSAGVQLRLDQAFEQAGIEPERAYTAASTHASHRDVVLAVVRGDAEVGLTTRAWAEQAGLPFHAIASESYALCVLARHLGHASVTALFEIAQTATFRRELAAKGYGTSRTGRLRFV